jgi:hypothetical protein
MTLRITDTANVSYVNDFCGRINIEVREATGIDYGGT